jgi:hypothetical protein
MPTPILSLSSVQGPSHESRNEDCEDSSSAIIAGEFAILVVSDGAGSAIRAKEGSSLVCREASELLSAISNRFLAEQSADWIVDAVIQGILDIRSKLHDLCGAGSSLAELHSTLVCALIGPQGGFFAHIGDGLGVVFVEDDTGKVVPVVSDPENGEYANTTFFITETHWLKHLRITPINGKVRGGAVFSDGASSLVQDGPEFDLESVRKILSSSSSSSSDNQSEEFLSSFLNQESSRSISGDDKSIALVVMDSVEDFNFVKPKTESKETKAPSDPLVKIPKDRPKHPFEYLQEDEPLEAGRFQGFGDLGNWHQKAVWALNRRYRWFIEFCEKKRFPSRRKMLRRTYITFDGRIQILVLAAAIVLVAIYFLRPESPSISENLIDKKTSTEIKKAPPAEPIPNSEVKIAPEKGANKNSDPALNRSSENSPPKKPESSSKSEKAGSLNFFQWIIEAAKKGLASL